jgi:hypothetical protein
MPQNQLAGLASHQLAAVNALHFFQDFLPARLLIGHSRIVAHGMASLVIVVHRGTAR